MNQQRRCPQTTLRFEDAPRWSSGICRSRSVLSSSRRTVASNCCARRASARVAAPAAGRVRGARRRLRRRASRAVAPRPGHTAASGRLEHLQYLVDKPARAPLCGPGARAHGAHRERLAVARHARDPAAPGSSSTSLGERSRIALTEDQFSLDSREGTGRQRAKTARVLAGQLHSPRRAPSNTSDWRKFDGNALGRDSRVQRAPDDRRSARSSSNGADSWATKGSCGRRRLLHGRHRRISPWPPQRPSYVPLPRPKPRQGGSAPDRLRSG
jgi:hypothetical protein